MSEYQERDVRALDRLGNYFCKHLSAMTSERLERKDAIAAELAFRDQRIDELKVERAALIRELVSCQNVLHGLAYSGECTPAYADGVKEVLMRVTGGQPPMFEDHRS